MNEQSKTTTQRECQFPDCDWSHDYDPDDYHSELSADFASERHYEREHAGRVRIRVTLETEQMLGDRNPREIADRLHDKWEDKSLGMDVAFTSAEVLEESDDHSKVSDSR